MVLKKKNFKKRRKKDNFIKKKKRKSINYHGIGFYSTLFLFEFCFKNKSVSAIKKFKVLKCCLVSNQQISIDEPNVIRLF
ncbi:hypothetical protein U3516DRAFT_760655 [Neocallimastix sp. 'constans']